MAHVELALVGLCDVDGELLEVLDGEKYLPKREKSGLPRRSGRPASTDPFRVVATWSRLATRRPQRCAARCPEMRCSRPAWPARARGAPVISSWAARDLCIIFDVIRTAGRDAGTTMSASAPVMWRGRPRPNGTMTRRTASSDSMRPRPSNDCRSRKSATESPRAVSYASSPAAVPALMPTDYYVIAQRCCAKHWPPMRGS